MVLSEAPKESRYSKAVFFCGIVPFSKGDFAVDDGVTEALRAEWAGLFDRLLAHGRSQGAHDALTQLMQSAQARLGSQTGSIEVGGTAAPAPRVRTRAQITQEGIKTLNGTRAAAGSVMKTVQSILTVALAPQRVQQIMETAKTRLNIELKDTSVRMALSSMREKGLVEQNELGEWHMTRRDGRFDSQAQQHDAGESRPVVDAVN